jgi:hypothetical protein
VGRILRINEIPTILIEEIEHGVGVFDAAFSHEFFPAEGVCSSSSSTALHIWGWRDEREPYHKSPKFIAPRQRGLALTDAVGEGMR